MSTIDEKRVYADRHGATDVYVASEMGLVHVSVADDAVGEFSLVKRCQARAIAAGPAVVAVGTETDVLLGTADSSGEMAFAEAGFGPAVAVAVVGADTGVDRSEVSRTGEDGDNDYQLIAANDSGRVAMYREGTWTDLDSDLATETKTADSPANPLEVRALDGDLLAAASGVYRLANDRLVHAGLSSVHDVSTPGVPLAATEEGLYKLGNGWMLEDDVSGPVGTVAADPSTPPGRLERAHAVGAGGDVVWAYEGAGGVEAGSGAAAGGGVGVDADTEPNESGWTTCPTPPAPVVDLAYGQRCYAVTADGQFLALADGHWRSHHLGVRGVTALAIPTS